MGDAGVTAPSAESLLTTVFSEVLGRPITYADPSVLTFVRRMYGRGLPLGYVLLIVGIYTTVRVGLAGRVTDDVARLLDRPSRSVRDYVKAYADRFESAWIRNPVFRPGMALDSERQSH